MMANVIQQLQKPTLIIAHNKTLARQLYEEFKSFFSNNSVEYFISYYDYYQPEAYIPTRDVYIEKEVDINKEIERFRHKSTQSLMSRNDVIIIASVSCIYGLGLPEEYVKHVISLKINNDYSQFNILSNLESIQFERNDLELMPGRYRIKGDSIDIFPASEQWYYHLEFFGDTLERIERRAEVTHDCLEVCNEALIFPATHYIISESQKSGIMEIRKEIEKRVQYFLNQNKPLEANRIKTRCNYDIELLEEIGYCKGIENYSQPLSGRDPGQAPGVLLDFFPDDFLTIIDESHVTMPQIKGMYAGDQSRKEKLIDYGFRLPSAKHNRPLTLKEFESKVKQILYVSATPGEYELNDCKIHYPQNLSSPFSYITEQLIRPTGLLDPELEVRSNHNHMQDLHQEILMRIKNKERTLVTTLTKKFAEKLADFFQSKKLKCQYLHSEIDTLERTEILNKLRLGEIDVLIGINLLREGLDLPEVSLVAILDADKQGFLRNERSLIQTIGRAARNVNGKAILYADVITESMKAAILETQRRRTIQMEYNRKNNIVPKTIVKNIKMIDSVSKIAKEKEIIKNEIKSGIKYKSNITYLQKVMLQAAKNLDFEKAAFIRDQIKKINSKSDGTKFNKN